MLIPLDEALKSRVVMLSGDEENPRRRSLKALLEAVAPDGDDYDLQTMEAEESSPATWLAAAGTTPFLSPRRTVVVRHLVRAGSPDECLPQGGKELSLLPQTALVILVADDEQGDADRQKRLRVIRTSWERVVAQGQGMVYSVKSDAKSVHAAVRSECDRLQFKMSARAVDLLAEMTGGSLSRALDELEKLAVFAAGESVQESDVREVVVPAREWSVFGIVDAVVAGNAALALKQLRVLVGSAQNAESAANQSIFPNLARQFRLLWQARVCLDAKVAPSSPTDAVRSAFPAKPNLATELEWRQQKAITGARKVSLGAISRCMALVADADATMKGLRPGFNGFETLEQMVLRMVETIKAG